MTAMEIEGVRDSRDPKGRHFSGIPTRLLIDYVDRRLGQEGVAEVLERAGEARTSAELSDMATWSSYTEYRALLEAAAHVLGGADEILGIGRAIPTSSGRAESATEALHSLGDPDAIYAMLPETIHLISSLMAGEVEQVAPREWISRGGLIDGVEPFREHCALMAGLSALPPTMFGFEPAEVVQEACQCDGAPVCVTRIRWPLPEETERAEAEYLGLRVETLENRLAELQRTVSDLVSGSDVEHVLTRIVQSAAHAVPAPSYALAVEDLPMVRRRVYAVGLDDESADHIAGEVMRRTRDGDPNVLIVEIASPTCRYGRLAAINQPGVPFLGSERTILKAYASLAAAALDGAAAMQEARQQTATAHALLELSVALAQVSTTDEMASRVVRALPQVVDCDHAVIALIDADNDVVRFVASTGYSPMTEALLRSSTFTITSAKPFASGLACYESPDDMSDERSRAMMTQTGSVAGASVPIMANSNLIGWIAIGVTERPERLRHSDMLADRLQGLAGQAANAICNARLLDQVRHQALHDTLTGLPNRALILDRAEHMLARARRDGHMSAALFIDLDNFKSVNDTMGHAVGDQLLRAVSDRISTVMRASDTVGRLGGDEFVVLTEGMSVAGPELIAERILELLQEPFRLETPAAVVLAASASIGIAFGDRMSAGELLRDADIALYRAKAMGRNCYAVFEESMQSEAMRRLELEMDLRTAIDDDRYLLDYQPIFALNDESIAGFEALLRWQHPTQGVIPPGNFIPTLEETGMIVDVGRWVLNRACQDAVSWSPSTRPLDLSVNVSIRQLESDTFIDDLRDALANSGLAPERLIVEITETALMRDTPATIEQLAHVKTLGVRIAIDDFGTGYSSLTHLRQFPIDILKIDRSFVSAMTESVEAGTFVAAIVKLGSTLGLATYAEGIEQVAQLAQLQAAGCVAGQGFLLSRPVAAELVGEFLGRNPAPDVDPDIERSVVTTHPACAGSFA